MEAMREVLWVLGAREEAGVDLATRLQRTAQRMLARQTIHWQAPPENPPTEWPAEARREVFLFFKETLANIVRHSRAKHVELRAQIENREFSLTIHDDGVGFDPTHVREGIGLKNMRERARDLAGHVSIDSSRKPARPSPSAPRSRFPRKALTSPPRNVEIAAPFHGVGMEVSFPISCLVCGGFAPDRTGCRRFSGMPHDFRIRTKPRRPAP